jgi:hypothetical protein
VQDIHIPVKWIAFCGGVETGEFSMTVDHKRNIKKQVSKIRCDRLNGFIQLDETRARTHI